MLEEKWWEGGDDRQERSVLSLRIGQNVNTLEQSYSGMYSIFQQSA